MTTLAALVARLIAWRRRRARHQWRSTRGRAVEAEANAWENATEHPIVALFGGLEEVLAAQAVAESKAEARGMLRDVSSHRRRQSEFYRFWVAPYLLFAAIFVVVLTGVVLGLATGWLPWFVLVILGVIVWAAFGAGGDMP